MRQLIYLFLIIFILFSCTSNTKNENELTGLWYAKELGVLSISDTITYFYSNLSFSPKKWPSKKGHHSYVLQGEDLLYIDCLLENDKDINISIDRLKAGQVILRSDHSCFPPFYMDDEIILDKFPEKADSLKYDFIRIKGKIDGRWTDVDLSYQELNSIDTRNNLLTINQQLWLLFYSGIDFHDEAYTPIQSLTIELRWNGYTNTKTINTYPNPYHLRPFLGFAMKKFQKKN